jgi:hypothetical protein
LVPCKQAHEEELLAAAAGGSPVVLTEHVDNASEVLVRHAEGQVSNQDGEGKKEESEGGLGPAIKDVFVSASAAVMSLLPGSNSDEKPEGKEGGSKSEQVGSGLTESTPEAVTVVKVSAVVPDPNLGHGDSSGGSAGRNGTGSSQQAAVDAGSNGAGEKSAQSGSLSHASSKEELRRSKQLEEEKKKEAKRVVSRCVAGYQEH